MATLEISPDRIESILGELDALSSEDAPWPSSMLIDDEDGERHLARYAPVEIRQWDDALQIEVALAGVAPKDLHVRLTPTIMLITADAGVSRTRPRDVVHPPEFRGGRACRSIHLPAAIDPVSAAAVYRHGLLRVTATIVRASRPSTDGGDQGAAASV